MRVPFLRAARPRPRIPAPGGGRTSDFLYSRSFLRPPFQNAADVGYTLHYWARENFLLARAPGKRRLCHACSRGTRADFGKIVLG